MRVSRHIVERRQERLRNLIRSDGFLPVGEICRRLGVSEATARRDLMEIEADGHITRTHGGALADYNNSHTSLSERLGLAGPAKARIADKAVALIRRTGTIFIDAGTSSQAVARALTLRHDLKQLTVATNSLAAAAIISGMPGMELHVVGGMFLNRQAALMGPRAIRALGQWSFDAAFLGCEAMDAQGVSNSHPAVADFQKAVLRRSAKVYFCIDASKIGHATPHRVAGWKQLTALITDAPAPLLSAYGIKLPSAKLLHV